MLTRPLGQAGAKVEVHLSAPSEPVCPAGEVLLLPAEEAVVPPAALEPLRPALGVLLLLVEEAVVSLVPPSEPRHSAVVLLRAAVVPLAAPSEPLRLALVVRLLFVKEAVVSVVAPSEPLHFALVVLRDAHGVEPLCWTQRSAREAGRGGGAQAPSATLPVVLGLASLQETAVAPPAQVPLAPKAEEAGVATAG
jgi:hypothetical protein